MPVMSRFHDTELNCTSPFPRGLVTDVADTRPSPSRVWVLLTPFQSMFSVMTPNRSSYTDLATSCFPAALGGETTRDGNVLLVSKKYLVFAPDASVFWIRL